MANWTEADIPSQRGRGAVVTGANSGIGFETARALAQRGARLPGSLQGKGRHGAYVTSERALSWTLTSLASVRAAATALRARYPRLNLLANNAGTINKSGQTAEGYEANFGVNHLGH